ncbi:MAG: helix-turn-helix transcriptional regulator [Proteobacteria bacterium]|uniref:Helix-turn-helix transcriptional regulator n=1 Tax=Candidatus Avisuccinivibrio stercorigallinarum TaxID=2840704 RepID=A0A9D9DDE7_9GAMM|nr:helix-turn-helix transcriptional regulator [Candidatus Avisuccinivibrio stercorigallinarum]
MQKILTANNFEVIPLDEFTQVRFYTSVDPGSYVAPHWHDALEMVYLQQGHLRVCSAGAITELTPGRCILINSGTVHSTFCSQPNRAVVFQIPEAFLQHYIPEAALLEFSFADPARTPQEQAQAVEIKQILLKMQKINDERPEGGILEFNSLLFAVLLRLYQGFGHKLLPSEAAEHKGSLKRLRQVLDFVQKNYQRPISLDEIAAVAGFERKYFCRFFKRHMGETFLNYLNKFRLSKIYSDVLYSTESISAILEHHGFVNYKLFRRMFAEQFQTTPSDLRKSRQAQLSSSPPFAAAGAMS